MTRRRPVALCLGGLSPAVVTETLYGLAVARRPRVLPAEVHVITTHGAYAPLVAALLGPAGAISRLRRDHGLPASSLVCTPAHVHVMTMPDARPLDDIRTERESRAAGEFIGSVVRDLTRDSMTELHCSLAGGRKTMSALLATALQLYGRPTDRLYHVLVNEPFDRIPAFFFPPRAPVTFRVNGKRVRSSEARVELAELPLVRLGAAARLLGYDDLALERIARELQAEAAGRLVPRPLTVTLEERRVSVGEVMLTLSPQELALYVLYASARAKCSDRDCRNGGRCIRCHLTDDEVHDRRGEIARWYERAGGRMRGASLGGLLAAEAHDAQQLSDFRAWLQQTRSRLNRVVTAVLGRGPTGRRYMVSPMGSAPASERQRRGLALAPRFVRVKE